MSIKKLCLAIAAAIAACAMSAVRPIVASASYYASPSGDSPNTHNDTIEVLSDITEIVTGKTSRTSQSFGCTVQATSRRAVFTRDHVTNNSISNGQVCLA
jgi:hypothetical protein